MKKQLLEFTLETKWELVMFSFNNETCFMRENTIFLEEKLTPEKIYDKVLEFENLNRIHNNGFERNIIWKYHVMESEKMTDNRSKFGHLDQSSERYVRYYVPTTYVRGLIDPNEPKKIMITGNLKMDSFVEISDDEYILNVFPDESLVPITPCV